jgi:hypothetical protein
MGKVLVDPLSNKAVFGGRPPCVACRPLSYVHFELLTEISSNVAVGMGSDPAMVPEEYPPWEP